MLGEIGYYCPLCHEPVFVLYEFGTRLPLCLNCCVEGLTHVPGTVICQKCHGDEVLEKQSFTSFYVTPKNKISILDEYMYCPNCENEWHTDIQKVLLNYRQKAQTFLKKEKGATRKKASTLRRATI